MTFRPVALAAMLTLSSVAAHAAFVPDAQGDFLATYTGTQGGDLDVLFAYGLYNAPTKSFEFGATMAAPIGTTAGALYVWGINRGGGTERFTAGAPSIGAGVRFDAVVLYNAGTGSTQLNLFNGQPATTLAAGTVVATGNSLTLKLDAALLPGVNNFSYGQYGWNFWPRQGAGQNVQISDFAPNASTPTVVTSVPEPASALMLAAGLGALLIWRRRAR